MFFSKKVVALLGSKRKVNTYKLLLQIKDLLSENNIELEIIELYTYDIKDCTGCDICVLKGNCVLKDDVYQIMDKLSKADGIILASPVYLQQVSGKMKTFFDRTCSWYHRPVLTAKPVLCVATTKGSGLKATLSYMENVASQWGAILAGSIGRSIFNLQKPVTSKEIFKFLLFFNNPQMYSPTLNQLIGFEVQKSLSHHLGGLDAEYWKMMNWMGKCYFYPCKVNPLKRAVSGLVGYIIRQNMSQSVTLESVIEQERKN
ncbi:MAG: flavodoxin family protein [Angelakisella sp.]|nr:flavodoxin family protein [Angelakisella sp.]